MFLNSAYVPSNRKTLWIIAYGQLLYTLASVIGTWEMVFDYKIAKQTGPWMGLARDPNNFGLIINLLAS